MFYSIINAFLNTTIKSPLGVCRRYYELTPNYSANAWHEHNVELPMMMMIVGRELGIGIGVVGRFYCFILLEIVD